tara:strand:+ start:334 stop:504 length:171 start_codon:yes stop_codon:yes gene_type:complete
MRIKKIGEHLIDSYEDWREYIITHHEVTKMKTSIKNKTKELKKSALKILNLKEIKK